MVKQRFVESNHNNEEIRNAKIQVETVAGTPTEATDDGFIKIDNTNDKLFFRSSGVWTEAGGDAGGDPYLITNYDGVFPIIDGAIDAMVLGENSRAFFQGDNSVVIGKNSKAGYGFDAIVIGKDSISYGADSIVIGDNAQVLNSSGIAIGENSITQGLNGISIGSGAVVNDSDGIAIGGGAQSLATDSIAIGDGALIGSLGTATILIGAGNTAVNASGLVSIGSGNTGNHFDSVLIGNDNTSDITGGVPRVNVIGWSNAINSAASGVNLTSINVVGRENTITDCGDVNLLGKQNTVTNTTECIVLGEDNVMTSAYSGIGGFGSNTGSIQIGFQNVMVHPRVETNIGNMIQLGNFNTHSLVASQYASDESIIIGFNNTLEQNCKNAIIIGDNSTTSDGSFDSIAIGRQTAINLGGRDGIAIGKSSAIVNASIRSIAIGTFSEVRRSDSIAIGFGAIVYSNAISSIAIGTSSNTGGYSNDNGEYAIAIGDNTNAYGTESIAIGHFSRTEDPFAIAIGTSAVAAGEDDIAIGRLASATGTDSISIGDNSGASGIDSVALGSGANANNTRAVQLSTGTNSDIDTLQFLTNRLANAQGLYTSFTAPSNYTPVDNDNVTSHFQAIDTALGSVSGGGSTIITQDEGVQVDAAATTLNFVGTGVTTTDAGGNVTTVTIPGGGSTIITQDEGVQVDAAATTLNFVGAGVTTTDAGGNVTTITIPGGGGDPDELVFNATQSANFAAADSDHGTNIPVDSTITITLPDSTVISKNIEFNVDLDVASEIITYATSGAAVISASSTTQSVQYTTVNCRFNRSINTWILRGGLT